MYSCSLARDSCCLLHLSVRVLRVHTATSECNAVWVYLHFACPVNGIERSCEPQLYSWQVCELSTISPPESSRACAPPLRLPWPPALPLSALPSQLAWLRTLRHSSWVSTLLHFHVPMPWSTAALVHSPPSLWPLGMLALHLTDFLAQQSRR